MIRGVRLRGVYQHTAEGVNVTEFMLDNGSKLSVYAFVMRFEFKYMHDRNDGADVGAEIDDDKECVASISLTLIADYVMDGDDVVEFNESELMDIANKVVLFQCWPYWREHCHNAFLRMHLPTVVLPNMIFPVDGAQIASV